MSMFLILSSAKISYRYICAPDAVHHMFIPEYKKEYPQAKVIGVPALVEKNKGVIEFDGGVFS